MKPLSARQSAVPPLQVKQRGVVLFIALIVLVAMALAAIALTRSVDTTVALAGNLAFRQAATQAADRGIEAATQWLVAQNATPNTLYSNNSAEGYFSAAPASEPNWYDTANWEGATPGLTPKTLAEDAAGNIVSYVIHRMCTNAGQPPGGANSCGTLKLAPTSVPGRSMTVGSTPFETPPTYYYRVTARAVGPHNSVSIVQSMVLLPN
jgi:type IV pilus assembly protein PilX